MLQRIVRYEILVQIGRGGQGTVYRAQDTGLDRIVAIKVIDQSVADDLVVDRSIRELILCRDM